MSAPPPSRQDLAVRQGPTIGNAPSVVVAMPSGRNTVGEEVLAELSAKLSGLQSTEKVELAPPRRGKRRSRERVLLTAYFAVGITVEKALKAVNVVVKDLLRRIRSYRPARRVERKRTRLKSHREMQLLMKMRRHGQLLPE